MADETIKDKIRSADPVIKEIMKYALTKQVEVDPEDISILSESYLDKEIKSLAAFVNGTRDAIWGVAHNPDDDFFIKYSDKCLDIAVRKLIAAMFIDELVREAVKAMADEKHNHKINEMIEKIDLLAM